MDNGEEMPAQQKDLCRRWGLDFSNHEKACLTKVRARESAMGDLGSDNARADQREGEEESGEMRASAGDRMEMVVHPGGGRTN